MDLTRRKDSYYVEFHVFDDGKHLCIAPPGAGKLKRWKVESRNQRSAKDQEAMIKTRLIAGQMLSPSVERARAVTFRDWAETYLSLEEVRKLATYEDRRLKMGHLVEYFWDRPLLSIVPEDVAAYRVQRMYFSMRKCVKCEKLIGRAICPGCGWERTDSPSPASVQTVNHDHTALTYV